MVARPALVEKSEPCVDGRFWICVLDGDELDVKGEPDVEADLVARFRESELLADREPRMPLVLVACPTPGLPGCRASVFDTCQRAALVPGGLPERTA
jgi:hypothetical protein